MSKVIEINNLSKVYDLGLVGTGTLSKDLNRSWAKLRGKTDPYATLVEVNDRTQKGLSNIVYALKDINFSVEQGEVLGIIGKNGAGKSTLLKILSQITSPSTGNIKMKGRVASLLEVGTGMHPEMTARQNIYLNGSLMGMRRHEITSTLDEIVDFAGIGKYIDTPVKRFSSGMSVRLGFAVAAFLEPEILIVDEVLAVGDYEFQKKAIGKMQDVSKSEGRTVLFVSHNMESILKLCTKGLILENGETKLLEVSAQKAVKYYLDNERAQLSLVNEKKWDINTAPGNDLIKLLSVNVKPLSGKNITVSSGFVVNCSFYNNKENINLDTTLEILTLEDEIILHQGLGTAYSPKKSKKGIYTVTFSINGFILNSNRYKINLIFGENQQHLLYRLNNICIFDIIFEPKGFLTRKLPGKIILKEGFAKSTFKKME
tara:strand:+ start:2947 stop:4233 length:1287 start_codon:yes stop_codon:yes gene_type:complete